MIWKLFFCDSKIIWKSIESVCWFENNSKKTRTKNENKSKKKRTKWKNIEKTQGFLRFLDVVKFDSKTKKPTRTGNKNEKITEKKTRKRKQIENTLIKKENQYFALFDAIWPYLTIFPAPEKGRSSSGGSSPCPRIRAIVVYWWKFQWWSTSIHKNSCPSSRRLWDDFDDNQKDSFLKK